jgi:hypothetical protein
MRNVLNVWMQKWDIEDDWWRSTIFDRSDLGYDKAFAFDFLRTFGMKSMTTS